MHRSRWTWGVASLATLLPAGLAAMEATPPTFGSRAEVVQVDVVVRDRKGNPVRGLTGQDFRVFEQGVAQEIESFRAVDLPEPVPAPAPRGDEARVRPSISSNVGAADRVGRTMLVLFDDMHLSPLHALKAKAALKAFITGATRDGDVLALASSSGTYWTTRLPDGREDLLTILRGLEGRRAPTATMDMITDYEAMRVHLHNDVAVGDRLARRLRSYQVDFNAQSMSLLKDEERARVFPGINEPLVEMRCAERYAQVRRLNLLTLGALRRAVDAVATVPGRKSLILVSEGFIHDVTLDEEREVTEAARRANVAVYFVDARGLAGLPGFMTAEFGREISTQDYGATLANSELDAEGAAGVAETTGGFVVRNSNDLAGAIAKVERDSRSYYVLGYSSKDTRRDGRYRAIRVQVARRDVQVRARKGYYAARDGQAPARPQVEGLDAALAEALDAPVPSAAIPLRAGAYVLGPSLAGQAKVKLAIEVDISNLEFARREGKLENKVEMVCLVAAPNLAEAPRHQQIIQLTLSPEAFEGYRRSWYAFDQEFDLAAGPQQARLLVRDGNGRLGTLIHDFEVPPLDALRVSTPVLTDVVETIETPERQTAAVPVARRSFSMSKPLYLQFEVYGAAGGLSEAPVVSAGYEIRSKSGEVVRRSSPKPIAPTSLGGLSRLVQIPAGALPPDDYELVLEVRDERGNATRSVRDAFRVLPSDWASNPPSEE